MAMTQIVNSDPFYTRKLDSPLHLMLKKPFGEREKTFILLKSIDSALIIHDIRDQKLRDRYLSTAALGLGFSNEIFLFFLFL